MNRFMGMMPANEIKMSKYFEDDNGLKVKIEAGPHGWTIIYADYSTQYEDVDATTEDNFEAALNMLKSKLSVIREINEPEAYEYNGEA